MKYLSLLALGVLLVIGSGAESKAGEQPSERVLRLALHLKKHFVYRDFNDYGAIAYGKVFEFDQGMVNVYYADANENLKVDDEDSLHIVDESGETSVSFVDQGLDGINDETDRVGRVNAVGAVIRSRGSKEMNERYLALVDSLLGSR